MYNSVRAFVPGAFAFSAAALGLLFSAPAAAADELDWQAGDVVLKASAAGILFDSSAKVEIGGAPVEGGGLTLSDGASVSGEIEYFLTPALSVSANFGIPLETRVDGTGTLAPAGEAGRVEYGLGAATLRYHLDAGNGFAPFLGVGVGRLFIFDETDGALSDFDVDGAWGAVIQGGADLRLNKRFGLYANVSYSPIKTDGRGTIFAAPASAEVKLNPTVVQGGAFFSF